MAKINNSYATIVFFSTAYGTFEKFKHFTEIRTIRINK